MANVAIVSYLRSYLSFSISYNATVLVTLFFLYRALAAHQVVEDEIVEEMESTVQITHNLNGPRVSHACNTRVTCV